MSSGNELEAGCNEFQERQNEQTHTHRQIYNENTGRWIKDTQRNRVKTRAQREKIIAKFKEINHRLMYHTMPVEKEEAPFNDIGLESMTDLAKQWYKNEVEEEKEEEEVEEEETEAKRRKLQIADWKNDMAVPIAMAWRKTFPNSPHTKKEYVNMVNLCGEVGREGVKSLFKKTVTKELGVIRTTYIYDSTYTLVVEAAKENHDIKLLYKRYRKTNPYTEEGWEKYDNIQKIEAYVGEINSGYWRNWGKQGWE